MVVKRMNVPLVGTCKARSYSPSSDDETGLTNKMNVKPPLNMHSGPIKLIFEKIVDVEPGGELVPFYHFKITNADGTEVGHINFKVGETNHIRQCVGHIGYEILPEYRGNSFSYFACNAIRPFIRVFYEKVILTCDPANIPVNKNDRKIKRKVPQ